MTFPFSDFSLKITALTILKHNEFVIRCKIVYFFICLFVCLFVFEGIRAKLSTTTCVSLQDIHFSELLSEFRLVVLLVWHICSLDERTLIFTFSLTLTTSNRDRFEKVLIMC